MRINRIKLVTEMARQEISQKELAERSGVSRATINYIKSGKSCSEEIGQKIISALGVDASKLLEN